MRPACGVGSMTDSVLKKKKKRQKRKLPVIDPELQHFAVLPFASVTGSVSVSVRLFPV